MSTTFFAGNDTLLLIKKQTDKDTPVTDFSDAMAIRVEDFTKDPVRVIDALGETDSSVQEGGSHVTSMTPGLQFSLYGRPPELDLVAEALLGLNDDSGSADPTSHTATPDQVQSYYSILEVLPYGSTRYEGCKASTATFTGQDDGSTELQVTGLTWVVLGITENIAAPDPLPTPTPELPFIYAEVAVSYDSVQPKVTKAFSVVVNRNTTRLMGDNGFVALDAAAGKFQVSGTLSRYTQDDTIMREVDTGDSAGTVPTAAIPTHSFSILFTRGTGADLRQFLISAPGISYAGRTEAKNLDGTPFVEVLSFRTEPQPLLADNIQMVTVNAKATP